MLCYQVTDVRCDLNSLGPSDFQSLVDVDRGSETQLQVTGNLK